MMKTKLKVAVDLDDVCVDYVGECIRLYGWPVQWDGGLVRMWPNADWAAHFLDAFHALFLSSLRPIPGAARVLRSLEDRCDFFYFSATKPIAAAHRERWLKENEFPSLPLICTGGFEEKKKWLSSYPPDVLIEDMSDVLECASLQGIMPVVFDTPWNRGVRCGRRVKTWLEIEKFLASYEPLRLVLPETATTES